MPFQRNFGLKIVVKKYVLINEKFKDKKSIKKFWGHKFHDEQKSRILNTIKIRCKK